MFKHRRVALCSAVFVIWGLGGIIALAITSRWDDSWQESLTSRMWVGMLFGLPASIGSLMLFSILLELCDRAVGPGARKRLMLEALTVASGIFVPLWFFVLRPHKPGHSGLQSACIPVIVAVALATVVVGLAVVIYARSLAERAVVLPRSVAAILISAGTTTVAAAACYGVPWLVIVSAVLVPAGGWVWNKRPPMPDQAELIRSDHSSPSSGLATAAAPVVALSIVAIAGYASGPGIDLITAIVGISNGFFLVGRQYLAFVDLKSVHRLLADSELHYRELAHTDPLTGLANRRGLLRAMFIDATSGAACVLMTLDLDGFKNVNDVRGHDAGDAVLIEVGQRLRLHIRPGDLAARLGGDEFAVLMWGKLEDAKRVAERLLAVLRQPYMQAGGSVYLSASIGLAGCASADSIPSLLRNADLAQRSAKINGKNRFEVYDETFDRTLRRRSTIEHELRQALEKRQLSLAYQPVVSLPSVRPVGAEALLRWTHPDLGHVSPGEFIPIAEESGQIEAIGAWVLHEACRQLSRWVAEGHDVWVSVNVSPRELHSNEYLARLREVLKAYKVPPQRLVLEVTEHAVAVDVVEFRRVLTALRALGVRIALDDFGAGYSSLGQLRQIPVDILKIDQNLVSDVDLVDVAARLGKRLGLQVIAEGICDVAHHKLVADTGCPYGQGFLFGRGVPAEHLEAMLVSMPPLRTDAAELNGRASAGFAPARIPVAQPDSADMQSRSGLASGRMPSAQPDSAVSPSGSN